MFWAAWQRDTYQSLTKGSKLTFEVCFRNITGCRAGVLGYRCDISHHTLTNSILASLLPLDWPSSVLVCVNLPGAFTVAA